MIFSTTATFRKLFKKLPSVIKKKVYKQLRFLEKNFYHPSLNIKKMTGLDYWEIRVNRHYRLTLEKNESETILRTVGSHDEGLGKK